MGGTSSKRKAHITTPTKDKKGKEKKKNKKDAVNGSTGVEEVSIQEKKDDAETIQVEDSSKAQEAESSKKGETDSTGSGNAPTEIVEDSPDKEHQKVAQLSDVQSPSEPSVSPVELEGKEIEKTATEGKPEVQSPQEVTAVKVEQEPTVKTETTEPVAEVKATQEPVAEVKVVASEPVAEVKAAASEPVAEVKAAEPEPVAEVKAAEPEPVVEVKAAEPEPVVEVKAAEPEPVAEVKATVPEPVAEVKATEPETKLEAALPEPIAEVTAAVPEPVVEAKAEVQEPKVEEKVEVPEPVIEATEVKAEISESVAEVKPVIPEPVAEVPEPVVEIKAEPINETIVPEPLTENSPVEAVAEQIIQSTPANLDEQKIDATKDLGSPVNEISSNEKPIETVVSENVPSEVDSAPVLETKVESPVTSKPQEENKTETNSEITSDKVDDTKDNQSPLQETISDTVSEESAQNASTPEGVTSMQDDLKSDESIPAPPPELIENSNLIDDKLNSNAQDAVTTPQSPVDGSHPVDNERLNGHAEEHKVNGIETQNGNIQETSALVNGEVILGNGPKTELATLISWKHGGQEVAVCGDFCNWGDNCTLIENEGIFSTKIKLPKGQHHIKFFVDGQWTVDENAPIVELEGHGQVNLLVVTEGSD